MIDFLVIRCGISREYLYSSTTHGFADANHAIAGMILSEAQVQITAVKERSEEHIHAINAAVAAGEGGSGASRGDIDGGGSCGGNGDCGGGGSGGDCGTGARKRPRSIVVWHRDCIATLPMPSHGLHGPVVVPRRWVRAPKEPQRSRRPAGASACGCTSAATSACT